MSDEDLHAALERLSQAHVLCVGDVMLDRFVYGSVSRISPEAPIPVLRVQREAARVAYTERLIGTTLELIERPRRRNPPERIYPPQEE